MTKTKRPGAKTVRPPEHTSPGAGQRDPDEKRLRVNTSVQRVILEELHEGPRRPRTKLRERSYQALATQGLALLRVDGKYEITPLGIEALAGKQGGRPSKFTGPWAQLVEHYGGLEKFAALVPCSDNTVRRWALHGSVPQQITLLQVDRLAKEARLPNPFLEDMS